MYVHTVTILHLKGLISLTDVRNKSLEKCNDEMRSSFGITATSSWDSQYALVVFALVKLPYSRPQTKAHLELRIQFKIIV